MSEKFVESHADEAREVVENSEQAAIVGVTTPKKDAVERMSRRKLLWRRFKRNKTAIVGLVGLILVILLAVLGPVFSPWEFTKSDRTAFLKPPSPQHWFGTNSGGYDMFAMTVEGLRKSLLIGFIVAGLQTTIAALVGASAAFFGSWFDKLALWVVDLLLVIPSFLIIAIITKSAAGTNNSVWFLIILLAAFGWMLSARVVRSLTLSVRSLDYVTAAKFMSVPSFSIIVRHILPNISSLLIIDATLGVASAVLGETALSYFGFGVQAPEVSLGTLIAAGQPKAPTHPWTFLPPAAVLTLALVCVNFVGDGVRDALDPSSKSAGGKA
ncbi:ABC transporter permease [Buchananella hordeovulneris]|uniref:ABC transporter permease n=1 Tax=Buchananella hordeovulneris TaxID=52770 RepID=UPI000F5F39FC|nr:ABC transporter permease [Buchananella hordeovulneris]RRD52660.1 ABC transporter permease [Buchananella hordeovulneris]